VHPDLTEPPISNLYQNDQFVDLRMLGHGKKEQTLTIPDPVILPVPLTLTKRLDAIFNAYGYIPNLERFLLYYPTYLEKHLIVEADLFESGKVEPQSAYFVALTAAAEIGSVYMMNRFLKQFLKYGGQTKWFTTHSYPQKLGMLSRLNRLMARAPWEINPEIIEDIL
jgi:hypothetical protein